MTHSHRVFISSNPLAQINSGTRVELTISQADSRHLLKVLRLPIGSEIKVISREDGRCYRAILTNASVPATIAVIGKSSEKIWPTNVASLSFALSKGTKNDLVCEKATELGVPRIYFFQAQRSVVRLDNPTAAAAKLKRWHKIAEAAAKQSGQRRLPEIGLWDSTAALIDRIAAVSQPGEQRLLCSLDPCAQLLPHVLRGKQPRHLVIGPEGDLSPTEQASFCAAAFELVSLGAPTLKSETAAIAAAAIAQIMADGVSEIEQESA